MVSAESHSYRLINCNFMTRTKGWLGATKLSSIEFFCATNPTRLKGFALDSAYTAQLEGDRIAPKFDLRTSVG